MTRVAFDHQIFSQQLHGGVSRYFASMIPHLCKNGFHPTVVAPLHVNEYISELPSDLVVGRRIAPSRANKRVANVVNDLLYGPLMRSRSPQIVHETYYSQERRAPRSAALVLTVYDMIHELFADDFPNRSTIEQKSAAIRRADWVLCISQSTRNDLLRFFPEVESRSSVTPLGFDPVPSGIAEEAAKQGAPYILFVGQRAGYKNFEGLLHAVAASDRLKREFRILCAGGGPFTAVEQQLIAECGLTGRVSQAAADSQQLQRLYRGAALFAYPSLYEGFGIPPLEAMAADCPVVAMRSSSIPEVCGSAAAYANVDDTDSLTQAIEEVAFTAATAAALKAAGHRNLQRFSWAKTAAKTAACYRSIT